jgi:predicted short-subunit dehydrogenase-like oxidoreductase (DUF2520 family)
MRLIVVGPGRAGLSLAIASARAKHEIVAIVGRDVDHAWPAASALAADALAITDGLPPADLLVIAVRDDAIEPVAAALAGGPGGPPPVGGAVHLSGLAPVTALEPLAAAGLDVGAFHPLQTLPAPDLGAARIEGAWVGITATGPLRGTLDAFAASLGAHPFAIADEAKPLYHAAAAAAANFPLAALTMAADLFSKSGVPFVAARPLVEAVVANAFELGPRAALTGPVARGDVGTVRSQLAAVDAAAPEWTATFAALVRALSQITGRSVDFASLFEEGDRA